MWGGGCRVGEPGMADGGKGWVRVGAREGVRESGGPRARGEEVRAWGWGGAQRQRGLQGGWRRSKACLLGRHLQAGEGTTSQRPEPRAGGPGLTLCRGLKPLSHLSPEEELSAKAPTADKLWTRAKDSAQGQPGITCVSLPGHRLAHRLAENAGQTGGAPRKSPDTL